MIVPARKTKAPLLRLYVDGGSRGNPGPAGCGVVLADGEGDILVEHGYFLGKATNNVAEYHGLLKGLELASQFQPERIEIFSDSELMVRQITGQYRVKSPDLQPLFQQAQVALLKFDSWQIRHIPRNENERADRLANLAMNRKGDVEDAGDDVPSMPAASAEPIDEPNGYSPGGASVQIRVLLGCDPRVCPATMMKDETFRCDTVTPEGLCLFAASSLLPVVIGLLNEASVVDRPRPEPIKVSCPRPGCHAQFELTLLVEDA